jgi:tetratricopeptide (TPR) repeat protein
MSAGPSREGLVAKSRTVEEKQVMRGPSALVGLLAVLLFVVAGQAAWAGGKVDFIRHKRAALAALDPQRSRITAKYEDDWRLRQFFDRVALIDEVSELLIERFASVRSTSFDDLLEGVMDRPQSASRGVASTMSASEILAQYAARFAEPLPTPSVTDEELGFLRHYYDACAKVAGQYIAARGEIVLAVGEESAADVLELSVVVPFLHISDQDWASEDVDELPSWMTTPENLAALETFAIRVRRPRTAFRFAEWRRSKHAPDSSPPLSLGSYLTEMARRMMDSQEYHAGIQCLKVAIENTDGQPEVADEVDLRFQLAKVYEKIGHASLAAGQMREVTQCHPKTPSWGKAAMLRLKYLYEAGLFTRIIEEAPVYQADQRCEPYLPQILYIAWVTHRREDRTEQAEKLQRKFLDRFSDHPLGADMYFASAMGALARSDYAEALRLLEVVEYRYPKSRLMKKIKQIQDRLEKTVADARKTAVDP